MIKRLLPTTLVAFVLATATAQSGCTIGSSTEGKPNHPTLADGAPETTCTTLTDCQGVQDPNCATPACTNGVCTFTYAPEGTAYPDQTPGDCRQAQCDGAGNVTQAPLDTDVPPQVAGDCKKQTCSGGSVNSVADDSDLPDASADDCTTATCKNGSVSAPPKPDGTLCTSNGGRYCNAGGSCLYCATLDAACDDPGPATAANDTEASAYDSGSVGNDDGEGKEVCGAFKSNGDVDWYHYEGDTESVIFGSPYENDPAGAVNSDVDVTLCIYMTCTEGATGDFVCPAGTTVATSAAGHDGCCLTGKNPGMDIRHVCANAGVWMSVTSASTTTCAGYDFSFHY